jgi:glycosyltransferase involved in cell wall biosynthesis
MTSDPILELTDTDRRPDANANRVTTIILTFNSEVSVGQVVESCRALSKRVLVVDSYSTDRTLEIARDLGCEIVQHEFINYSAQRNWAQSYAELEPQEWVLHLDSDEVLSPELAESMQRVVAKDDAEVRGYLVRRLSYFLGHPIRYGSLNPSWHLRLYRAADGQCEDRLYDQHYIVSGKTERLNGPLLDLQLVSIEKWTAAHNRWSTAEAEEARRQMQSINNPEEGVLPANLMGDIRMKKRWLKNNLWYKSPLFLRAFIFFFYSYVIRLGFLDGKVGLVYHVLQSFWFRFLVDAKILEQRREQTADRR